MTTPPQDIVITGLGLVSSLGASPEATWAAILAGRSGLGSMAALEQRPTPDKGGGQAVDLPGRESTTDASRAARYLRFAIQQALEHAGGSRPRAERIGVVMGTTLHGMRAGGEFLRTGDAAKLRGFLAGSVLDEALEGMEVRGPRMTNCSACSSGLGSIALAATLLRAGVVDVVVAGGYDSVSEYSYGGFDSLRLIAPGPPRPFGADRDGMKVAEGYGAVVLERAADAAGRGAAALAVLAGFGESSDAFHLTQPHPEGAGAAEAIRRALGSAGVSPEQIDMVSAHATSTPNNDAAEYAGLAAALGESLAATPVVAFKSHLGHTLGGAGAVELVLSVLAMRERIVPPTAGAYDLDPAMDALRLVRGAPAPRPIGATLNLSLGFGGINTAVVLRDKPAERPPAPTASPADPVVTGIGLILPGAIGRAALPLLLRDRAPLAADTGDIPEAAYAHLINARRTRRMSGYAKLTLAAAADALADAGVGDDAAFLSGCSGILGTTHGSSPFCEAYYGEVVRDGVGAANPVLFAEGVPNAGAAHLSMTFGIRGGCQTIIGTRCAGLEAVMLAALRIREGLWDRAVVGAAEEFSPVVNAGYGACGLHGGEDGFFAGAGAVTLVLESRRSAEARGAMVLASLGEGRWDTGGGVETAARIVQSFDGAPPVAAAWSRTRPDRAAAAALQRAGVRGVLDGPWPLPELFSVGPLAAMIAALAKDAREPFVALAAEFSGRAAGLLVRPTGNAALSSAGEMKSR